MSLLDRLEVPLAQSRAPTIAVLSPRVTASSAEPAPTPPPPTTRMSTSASLILSIMLSRVAGDSSAPTGSAALPRRGVAASLFASLDTPIGTSYRWWRDLPTEHG